MILDIPFFWAKKEPSFLIKAYPSPQVLTQFYSSAKRVKEPHDQGTGDTVVPFPQSATCIGFLVPRLSLAGIENLFFK